MRKLKQSFAEGGVLHITRRGVNSILTGRDFEVSVTEERMKTAREKKRKNRISERCSYLMGTKLPSTMEEANEMKRSRGDKLERKPVYTVYTNDRLLERCANEEIEESFVTLYSLYEPKVKFGKTLRPMLVDRSQPRIRPIVSLYFSTSDDVIYDTIRTPFYRFDVISPVVLNRRRANVVIPVDVVSRKVSGWVARLMVTLIGN
ncbi:hypothetical protein K0M31_002698 [Melipona bicolor]|uniref:Uncharacterized protein n=1 Tax=Melipona bicolor TaxID=60889 RepID=A0AA40FZJ2_9HYME|nr:hypothetical protein K0M31_002698 [Melipona bicolor]